MLFKDNYVDRDRQTLWTLLQKEQCKKYEGFGAEELLKNANDTDQTKLTITQQTVYYWSSNSLNQIN